MYVNTRSAKLMPDTNTKEITTPGRNKFRLYMPYKLNKNSTTTYAIWCEKHGFKWASKLVPMEWMNEKKNERRIDAIKALNTNEKA